MRSVRKVIQMLATCPPEYHLAVSEQPPGPSEDTRFQGFSADEVTREVLEHRVYDDCGVVLLFISGHEDVTDLPSKEQMSGGKRNRTFSLSDSVSASLRKLSEESGEPMSHIVEDALRMCGIE